MHRGLHLKLQLVVRSLIRMGCMVANLRQVRYIRVVLLAIALVVAPCKGCSSIDLVHSFTLKSRDCVPLLQ